MFVIFHSADQRRRATVFREVKIWVVVVRVIRCHNEEEVRIHTEDGGDGSPPLERSVSFSTVW